MAERDAFGRERDDDPLEFMRSGGTGLPMEPAGHGHEHDPPSRAEARVIAGEQARAANERLAATSLPGEVPASAAAAADARRVAAQTAAVNLANAIPGAIAAGRGVPRAVGRVVALLVALAVLGGVAAGAAAIIGAVSDAVDSAEETFKGFSVPEIATPGAPGAAGAGADRDPVGLGRGSMLTRTKLAAALRQLDDNGPGADYVRVAPDRVDAAVAARSGAVSQVQITAAGDVRVTSSGEAGGKRQVMRLDAIDPAAPFRLTRSAAGRLRKPTSQVSYVLATLNGKVIRWNVYFKGGQAFEGDFRGKVVRRIS